MSLPISPRVTVPYTPPGYEESENPPIYKLRPTTLMERFQFRARLTAAGIAVVTRDALFAAIRKAIVMIEDGAVLFGDLVDAVELAQDNGPKLSAEDVDLFGELMTTLRATSPSLRQTEANHQFYFDAAPIVAVQMFLDGWENLADAEGQPLPFRRDANGVVEPVMASMPGLDLKLVGYEIMRLMTPSVHQAGNSASRSPSPVRRARSTSKTTTRSQPKAGRSAASRTKKTQLET